MSKREDIVVASFLLSIKFSIQKLDPCSSNYWWFIIYGLFYRLTAASLCRMSRVLESSAVILVANKTDLVKSRVVKPADGKQVAVHYNIKYIETSPGGPHTSNNSLFSKMNYLCK